MTDTLAVDVSANDHVRGAAQAPITIVEYGDFTCPYCAKAYPILRELLRHHQRTLRLIFRHNPRADIESGAKLAAQASEAAGLQGKFWELHDLLFERPAPISESCLEAYAQLLQLDLGTFKKDLHSPAVSRRVREDQIGGLQSGVIGTPTFFVNGCRFQGKPDLISLSDTVRGALLTHPVGW